MTKNDNDKIKDCMNDTVFLNLYKYGKPPYWTMHTSRELAEHEAEFNRQTHKHEPIHVALPVHEDWLGRI